MLLVYSISRLAKNTQVNIRFDELTAEQLEHAASGLGMSVSGLVRHVTRSFLDELKKTGSMKLRPELLKSIETADARSAWGQRKLTVTPDNNAAVLNDAPNADAPKSKGPVKYPKGRK